MKHMKWLSLCGMLAIGVSMFTLTACGGDDEEEDMQEVTQLIASVVSEGGAKGYASASYTYVLDGVTYNSIEELNAAIAALPMGSTHTAQVIITSTAADGTKTSVEGEEFTFTVPSDGSPIVIPEEVIPALPSGYLIEEEDGTVHTPSSLMMTDNAAAEAADKGYVSAFYSFVLDGVTYDSFDEVNAVVASHPGSSHTVQVIITGHVADGSIYVVKGNQFTFTVPTDGTPIWIPENCMPTLPIPESAGAPE